MKAGGIIYILILVLNEIEYLEDILNRFMELGVSGGTIIDSTGMAETILCNDKIPTVGGLRQLFEHCRPSNKTIFSIIENKEKLQKAQDIVQGEVCDFREPGVGVSFTIPIENVIGLTYQ